MSESDWKAVVQGQNEIESRLMNSGVQMQMRVSNWSFKSIEAGGSRERDWHYKAPRKRGPAEVQRRLRQPRERQVR